VHSKIRNVRALSIVAAALSFAPLLWALDPVAAADVPKQDTAKVDYAKISPTDLAKETPKGQLKNPYNESQADILAQGERLYMSYGCNGCHGGGGGGGMAPPLTNDVWIYGGDDDTLFRLVALGSVDLQKQGYTRKGSEHVVGPMPPFGTLLKSSDEMWKIMAFIRSKYSANADPTHKYGTP
jgi:mono/diheme cytochrome c family protein